jgi:hypothetical protein
VSRLEIEQARSDLSKVTDTINMLRTEGLDASTAELLLSRKKFATFLSRDRRRRPCGRDGHCRLLTEPIASVSRTLIRDRAAVS